MLGFKSIEVFNRRTPLDSLYESMALTSARHPATDELRTNVRSALDAVALLLIISAYSDEPWRTEVICRTIAQRAFAQRYSGKWRLVQEILEQENPTPETVILQILQHMSLDDFFGNLVPRACGLWKQVRFKDMTAKDTRPVVRPQFRRGYRDKGSRRLPHELHGEPPSRPPQTDRRHKVHFNPLVELRPAQDALTEDWPEDSSKSSSGGKEELQYATENNS